MQNILDTCKRIAEASMRGLKTRAHQRQIERAAKKAGVPVAVIEYGEFVMSNVDKAQEVSLQFNDALAELGYKIDGKIETNKKGEQRLKIVLVDLSYKDHQDYLKFKSKDQSQKESPST